MRKRKGRSRKAAWGRTDMENGVPYPKTHPTSEESPSAREDDREAQSRRPRQPSEPLCFLTHLRKLELVPSSGLTAFLLLVRLPRATFPICGGWRTLLPFCPHGVIGDVTGGRHPCQQSNILELPKASRASALNSELEMKQVFEVRLGSC